MDLDDGDRRLLATHASSDDRSEQWSGDWLPRVDVDAYALAIQYGQGYLPAGYQESDDEISRCFHHRRSPIPREHIQLDNFRDDPQSTLGETHRNRHEIIEERRFGT